MEKQEYSQLDLFNKPGESESAGSRLSGTFLSYIRTYERLVLMLIGIVITGVVCFCVGVEKGKQIAMVRMNSDMDIARTLPQPAAQQRQTAVQQSAPAQQLGAPQPKIAPQPVQKFAPAVTVAEPVVMAKAAVAPKGIYTIQIGSYQGRISAQRETELLKKQGLQSILRPSGKYTVLCVGSFTDQATAKSLLTQLKRKYRDCYIRRL